MPGSNRRNSQGYPLIIVSRQIIACTFFFGVVFGAGMARGFQEIIAATQPPSTSITSQYNLIQPDITLTEARSILGPGIEILKSKSITIVAWHSSEGQTITATFQNNQLVEKALSGTQYFYPVEE